MVASYSFNVGALVLEEQRNRKAGGADRDRTCDLLIANETLYQLSYDPIHQFRPAIFGRNHFRAQPKIIFLSARPSQLLRLKESGGHFRVAIIKSSLEKGIASTRFHLKVQVA